MSTLRTLHPQAAPIAPMKVPSFGKDPLGLRAGWRGFTLWRELDGLSDAKLAQRGLKRADIPALVLQTIVARD